MALQLQSTERVREPGFSRSECLELARLIDGGMSIWDDIECDRLWCEGKIRRPDITPRQLHTIVAALRAYANE